ncbi:MAG: hypothetical protein AAF996_17310 [Pseudomonadota bacterium]
MEEGTDAEEGVWRSALRRAALPNAEKVVFFREQKVEDNVPTTAFRLTSFDAAGVVIGDDRDYDLLKAVMTPLENLAASVDAEPLRVELNLLNAELSFSEG